VLTSRQQIDSVFQKYKPDFHLIIEPHQDVLSYARSKGWYDLPGVKFFEGTWQQYQAALSGGSEEYVAFDAVYFDTYSEHYSDLHAFFDMLPDLLAGPNSLFSFFHGLGATSRLFYDVYTEVSEMHLKEVGLSTEWEGVKVGTDWGGLQKVYWSDMVGEYRLPTCRLDY
jgi:protein arginine N-methyltransferase 2